MSRYAAHPSGPWRMSRLEKGLGAQSELNVGIKLLLKVACLRAGAVLRDNLLWVSREMFSCLFWNFDGGKGGPRKASLVWH